MSRRKDIVRTCANPNCNKEFVPGRYESGGAIGKTKTNKFCSTECKKQMDVRVYNDRTCTECFRLFKPHYSRQMKCNDCEIKRVCANVECGKTFIVGRSPNGNLRRAKTCSEACRWACVEQTSIEKYGTKNPGGSNHSIEEIKKTNRSKRGCDFPFQCQDVRDKHKETLQKKYGVEFTSNISGVLEKKAKNNLLKGHTCSLHFPAAKEKTKITNL